MQEVFEKIKEYMNAIICTVIMALAVLLIVVAIYCSATQPKEGVVVRKNYQPPHTTTHYTTITSSDGKTTRIPVQEYHDAAYQIVIKGINSKGEEDLGYYYVTPTEYENIKIGDYYVKQLE